MRDHGCVRYRMLALVAVARSALAQPAPATRATALFEQGRDLARQGDFSGACGRFADSYALDPATGTELNLGDCHQRLGHDAEAWRWFDDAATRFAAAHDKRAKFARDRRDALTPRLGTIVVKLADPHVKLTIAGRAVPGAAEVHERVDAGTVEISAGPATRSAQVPAGGTVVVDFTAAPVAPPATEPPAEPATERPVEPTTTHGRSWQKLTAYGAGGASVVAGAIAIGLGIDARSRYNTTANSSHCTRTGGTIACDPTGVTELDRAIHTADIGTGFAVGSVVLLAAGAVLYFTAPKDAVVVAPTAGVGSAGLMISGSF